MKFSKNFERDYNWYLKYKDVFAFSGSPQKGIKRGDKYTAKEAFYLFDSQGKTVATVEPELLQQIFKCKEGINFQIKQWVEGLSDYNFPFVNVDIFLNTKDLVWKSDGTFTKESIIEQYELLPWMVEAIKRQREKIKNR